MREAFTKSVRPMLAWSLSYFFLKVPETKGKSLQELEQERTGRAVG
jgi:hypothetical protein